MTSLQTILDSRDVDASIGLFEQLGVWMDVPTGTNRQRFHAACAVRFMDRSCIARVDCEAPMVLALPESADYVLSVPIQGQLVSTIGGDVVVPYDARGTLHSPVHEQRMRATDKSSEFFIGLRTPDLQTYFARFTGEPVVGEIEFTAHLDNAGAVGRAVRAAIDLLVSSASSAERNSDGKVQEAAFEDALFSTLLLYHTHSHSDRLHGTPPAPAPRDVKRVMDYIQANLGDLLRLEDLIAVGNVPGRTLNEHFRAFTGLSPLAYVKRERLKMARRILIREPETSVTEAALRCGVVHLGRFAKDYARAYGEAPLTTRREHHARHQELDPN